MVLTAEYSEMVKGNGTDVNELLKHKTPKRLNDFELTILYCDEDRKEYNTIIKIKNGIFIKE